ncbi:MAG: hypothetical protein ACK55Z_25825 [bacterium]
MGFLEIRRHLTCSGGFGVRGLRVSSYGLGFSFGRGVSSDAWEACVCGARV